MADRPKEFFGERSPRQIAKALRVQRVFTQRGLVRRIINLNPAEEALELRTVIIPGEFRKGASDNAEAARRWYKHGKFMALSQPDTREKAYASRDTPLSIRVRDFESLEELREEEIPYIGIQWQPVQGNDKRFRRVPFDACLEGAKLYAYAEHMTQEGVQVDARYINSRRVAREGARILCTVPSTTKKEDRYELTLIHVPVIGVTERRAAVWSLRTQYEKGREPKHKTYTDLRYTRESEPETSDVFTFDNHDIAAYCGVIRAFWEGAFSTVPLEMNPFPLPSKIWKDFYKKLENNVVMYEPPSQDRTKKERLRKLYLPEKCLLLARSIPVIGPSNSAYWHPERDGPLRDYDWAV